MAFPQTQLGLRVDLQLAGAWTDITADVRVDQGVTITRGRANEASRPDPQMCALKLKNRDGRYSPRNPTSPYFGLLGRNTPLRVGVGTPPLGAAAASLAGSTNLVAPSVTAEGAGRLFCVWGATPVGNVTVPGGLTGIGAEQDSTLSTWRAAYKDLVAGGATGVQTATYSLTATAQCALSVVVPGSSGAFSTWLGIDHQATSFGVAPAGTVSVGSIGDYLLVIQGWSSDPRDDMARPPFLNQARSPAWVLLADSGAGTGPRVRAWIARMDVAGTISVSVDGIPNTDAFVMATVLPAATVTDYYPRFSGEVSTWPVSWDLNGADVATPITASGVRRRLASGDDSSSALRRELLQTDLVAYWPLEDGAAATAFGSAIGGPPMAFQGTPLLAADDGFKASAALPTFNTAGAKGVVPAHASTNAFTVGSVVYLPVGIVDETVLLTITTTGSARTWTVKYEAGASGFRVEAWDVDGVSLTNQTIGPWSVPAAGGRFYLMLSASASGADISWTIRAVAIKADLSGDVQFLTFTLAAQTVGRVITVQIGGGDAPINVDAVFGHIAVAANTTSMADWDVFDAAAAWTGKTSIIRMRDLARRGDVLVGQQGAPVHDNGALMGPQLPGTFLSLLDEAADSDGGVLVEAKGYLGFQIRSRSSKQSQTPWTTLNYATKGHVGYPIEPVDDDQATVNDVTVTRVGGRSVRVEQGSGPLSVAPPPAGVGRYSSAVELSLLADDQVLDQAAWRVHLGTWDEARWPTILTRLEAAPSMIPTMAALDVGDVITLTGLPAWVPPGPVDLMLEGYTETLMPFSWEFVGNYGPAGPWRVGLADDAVFGRCDSEGATLSASLTTTATSVSVATDTAGGHALWITTAANPTEFPFDVLIGGERMTVTAITGATSPQTFTVTRSVNGVVKAHSAGEQVRLAVPIFVA